MSDLSAVDAQLLSVRATLSSAISQLDDVTRGLRLSSEDRELVAATIQIVNSYSGEYRADALRWVRAARNREDAWLILHSTLDGEVEARYHAKLGAVVRRALG